MLDAYVDSFFDIAIADAFVDYNTDCGFSDVVDDASLAVINFVGHSKGWLGDV